MSSWMIIALIFSIVIIILCVIMLVRQKENYSIIDDVGNAVVNTINNAWQATHIPSLIDNAQDGVMQVVNIAEKIPQAGEYIIYKIKDGVESGFNEAQHLVDTSLDGLNSAVNSIADFDYVGQIFNPALQELESAGNTALKGAENAFDFVYTNVRDGVKPVYVTVKDGVLTGYHSVRDTAISGYDYTKDGVLYIGHQLEDVGKKAIDGFKNVLDEIWSFIQQVFGVLKNIVVETEDITKGLYNTTKETGKIVSKYHKILFISLIVIIISLIFNQFFGIAKHMRMKSRKI